MEAAPGRTEATLGKTLGGFFLSGFLMALLGTILPVWGYHRDPPEFITVGNYFLCLGAAVILSNRVARHVLPRGIPFALVFACLLACLSLLYLALVTPPASAWWRMAGVAAVGLAAGLLNTALLDAIAAGYALRPAATVAEAGSLYGLGCLAATLLVTGTLRAYTAASILIFMAVVPALFAGLYVRAPIAAAVPGRQPTLREAFRDFRSPRAVMFALLLFFQFGNEWSLAGWLPLFLIRRLGISPTLALGLLALYWVALLLGRVVAISILGRVHGGKLLLGSVPAAIFGLALLYLTDNAFGAGTGVVFVGGAFAIIYPLLTEKIGLRFPYYNPAFFSGIFTFALMGGMLAPATLGYFAAAAGLGVIMALPLAGMTMVLVLLGLIWLEAKVSGR
jgi:FHS family glucose/mannose:H+ symporter-like MFS transporter